MEVSAAVPLIISKHVHQNFSLGLVKIEFKRLDYTQIIYMKCNIYNDLLYPVTEIELRCNSYACMIQALAALHEENATYPKKITYAYTAHTSPRLAVEALEASNLLYDVDLFII